MTKSELETRLALRDRQLVQSEARIAKLEEALRSAILVVDEVARQVYEEDIELASGLDMTAEDLRRALEEK